MGLHEEGLIAQTLPQLGELLPDLPGRNQIAADVIDPVQPVQHREKLGCETDMAAQRPCPNVGLLHLRGGIAPGRHQCRPERQLQFQLALRAFGAVRRSFEQLQSAGQVADRLKVG